MFPVTITLQDAAQLTAVMQALGATSVSFDESTKVVAPKPKSTAATTAPKTEAAPTPTATTKETEVKADPKPVAAATAPAQAAAQTASSDAGMTEADLTKVIVATVARAGKDVVLTLLQDEFNVTAGKQITDPAVRAQAKAKLEAL